ncbi:MAG: hypothetical protein QW356_08735 [Candidatus Hadarchaeales archaeon]
MEFQVNFPMLFRRAGEFSPQARGPFSFARSLVMPSPSTLAGCLATARRNFGGVKGGWDEAVVKALGLEGGFLRGPYLLDGDDVYIGVERKEAVGLLNLKDLERYVKLSLSRESSESQFSELIKPVRTTSRLGIGLKSRKEGKTVNRDKGLMYRVELVDYPATFGKESVRIGMDIHGADLGLQNAVCRLGGEGKVSRVQVLEGHVLWPRVEKVRPKHKLCLCLLTYALLKEVPRTIGEIESGCYLFPDLFTGVQQLIVELTNHQASVESVVGELTLFGVGYDMRGRRKPSYVALKPGSVIELRVNSSFDLTKLYENGITVKGGQIGYGTFLSVVMES